jgi:hypothetical protein
MSRKTALRLDDESLERTARVPRTRRSRRTPTDGRLVGEVIAIAFDRCEAHDAGTCCIARPDAICSGCGTARCPDHVANGTCTTCAAGVLLFTAAPFEEVVDTRLRLGTVQSF